MLVLRSYIMAVLSLKGAFHLEDRDVAWEVCHSSALWGYYRSVVMSGKLFLFYIKQTNLH